MTNKIQTVNDAAHFMISQLAHLDKEVFFEAVPGVYYTEMVPMIAGVPEWADEYDYISFNAATMGKFIGASAKDLPNIGLNANKSKVKIGYAGNMFDYTLQELRKYSAMGMSVDGTKARFAYEGAKRHMQDVVFYGDKERGMTGLLNNANVTKVNSTVNWNTATAMEILNDINSTLRAVWTRSKTVHVPNALAIDPNRYAIIASKVASDINPQITVLDVLKMSNFYTARTGQQLSIFPAVHCSAAYRAEFGETNKDLMMAYELTAQNLGYCNPIAFRPTAPQIQGTTIRVDNEYSVSGAEIRRPFSAIYKEFDVVAAE